MSIRIATTIGLCLGLAACAEPSATVPGLGAPAPNPPAEQALAAECVGDAAEAAQMLASVNATRAAEGKALLEQDDRLMRIAQSHACDMARRGRLDVAGSNGSNVVDRARAVDYPTCGVVQLVGRNVSAPAVVSDWMRQGPQREQVLGQLSFQIGAGAVRSAGGQVWHSVVLGNNCR